MQKSYIYNKPYSHWHKRKARICKGWGYIEIECGIGPLSGHTLYKKYEMRNGDKWYFPNRPISEGYYSIDAIVAKSEYDTPQDLMILRDAREAALKSAVEDGGAILLRPTIDLF